MEPLTAMNRLVLSVAVLLTVSCRSQPVPDVRFTQESAKQQFDKASLIVLGKVEAVKDDAPKPGVSGYRQVEVSVSVDRVLKGELALKSICVTYFVHYGNYSGPGFKWIEHGATGFFAIEPTGRCFRVMNDRRAFIQSYSLPAGQFALEEFVARASLPVPGVCSSAGARDIPEDITWVSFPLAGPRTIRTLLENHLTDSDPVAVSCACSTIAALWSLHAQCLDGLSSKARESSLFDLDEMERSDRQMLRTQLDRFRSEPVEWLDESVAHGGVDGALLDIEDMTMRLEQSVDARTCSTFKNHISSSSFASARAHGSAWSAEAAERAAIADLVAWTDGGCSKVVRRSPAANGMRGAVQR